MLPNLSHNLHDTPIYRKAQEIFDLSRSISTYLNHDLCELNDDGSEKSEIYFSGDIVQQSNSLAPEIIKAESYRNSEKRHLHIRSLRRLTNRLYKNSYRLENCQSNGKDYLPILRKELKKFRKLQRSWMMTL